MEKDSEITSQDWRMAFKVQVKAAILQEEITQEKPQTTDNPPDTLSNCDTKTQDPDNSEESLSVVEKWMKDAKNNAVPVEKPFQLFQEIKPESYGEWAKLGTVINSLSDKVELNDRVCALGGAINTPRHFYVNIYQYWNELEDFMKEIQASYRAMMFQGFQNYNPAESVPNERSLLPGLYVVAWFKKEWHRARILSVSITRSQETRELVRVYTVRFIDFGDTKEMEIQDLRRLMMCFTKFPAQAIRCALTVKNKRNEEVVQDDWTPRQSQSFLRILYDRGLAIHFLQSTMEEGEKTWHIRLDVLKPRFSSEHAKISTTHEEITRALVLCHPKNSFKTF